jgi:uncharacterized protein YecT (DUF1311 family)
MIKHLKLLGVAALWLLTLSSPVRAQALQDCSRFSMADGPALLDCLDANYAILDKTLNTQYKQLMSTWPEEKKTQLRTEQRAWLKTKMDCKKPGDEGIRAAIQAQDCANARTGERVKVLAGYLNAGQSSGNTANAGGNAGDLDYLFRQGGYWVLGQERGGQSCSSVLAQAKMAAVFKRFESQKTQIVQRIGGQHPFKNDPSVAQQINRTFQPPSQSAMIATSPTAKVKITTRYPNGGSIEEFYELRPANNTIVRVGVGKCTDCDEAQRRVQQNFSGPEVIHWCSGGV